MSHVNLALLRRKSDQNRVSPFAPFPGVLAPATDRDYTITPSYEVPVFEISPLRYVAPWYLSSHAVGSR